MAIEFVLCQKAVNADCSLVTYEDQTENYGLTGNASRHELAHKYLGFKLDINGLSTLLVPNTEPTVINTTGQVDPNNYVADLFIIPSAIDGYYLIVLLSIQIWNSVTNYTAESASSANDQSVIYYTPTGKFYQAIQNNTNTPPDGPGGTNIWQEIAIDTEFQALIDNTSLTTFRFRDVVACKTEAATRDRVEQFADDFIAGKNPGFKEIEEPLIFSLMLDAMYAGNAVDKQFKSEKIARFIEKKI